MTQATTWSVPLVGPSTPTDFSQRIDDSLDALLSGHSGSSRPSYAVAGTVWQDTSIAGTVKYYHYDGSADRLLMTINTSTGEVSYRDSFTTYGNCRLTLSGGNLLLSRMNGRLLTINGIHNVIPSAGVTLAATGLTPATTYYIYAYINSGTMALEASTTSPATDSTTGVQIKSGDATRSLVGMARPLTGPAWVDTQSQRLVISYFNRKQKKGESFFTTDFTTSSGTHVELSATIRVEFLAWGDENLGFSTSGSMSNSGNSSWGVRLSLDGTTDWFCQNLGGGLNAGIIPAVVSGFITPSVGYHYATLLGNAGGASTSTFYGSNTIARCFIHASIPG